MKKLIAGVLAATTILSINTTAFAATQTKDLNIGAISGRVVFDDGRQLGSAYSADNIEPNQTIYFTLPSSFANLMSSTKDYRISTRKNKGSKYVKSVKIVEKRLTSSNTPILLPNKAGVSLSSNNTSDFAMNGTVPAFNGNKRNVYLAVELNDYTGTDEQKIELTSTITLKKAAKLDYGTNTGTAIMDGKSGDKIGLKVSFFMGTKTDVGDADVTVGKTGKTIKPMANSDNEITFEGDDTLAILRFKASSNPDKFFAKLNTKWTSELNSIFGNTDAVVRNFSAATISSASRATLLLANPFDTDDIDPEDVYIYSVNSKGKVTNVTSNFWYDDDEDAFCVRTRTLGTWIISDRKVKL